MTDPTPFVPDGWSPDDPGFGTYRYGDLPEGWECVAYGDAATDPIPCRKHNLEPGSSSYERVVVARKKPGPKVTITVGDRTITAGPAEVVVVFKADEADWIATLPTEPQSLVGMSAINRTRMAIKGQYP